MPLIQEVGSYSNNLPHGLQPFHYCLNGLNSFTLDDVLVEVSESMGYDLILLAISAGMSVSWL